MPARRVVEVNPPVRSMESQPDARGQRTPVIDRFATESLVFEAVSGGLPLAFVCLLESLLYKSLLVQLLEEVNTRTFDGTI